MTRKYTLKKRAQDQAETRQRIVDAAVELHGTLGPAHTSISAIAKRAGVQRVTVYDHFPDERAIFEACTSHYLALYPPPDPGPWQAIQDPAARLKTALTEVYAYYARTEPMMTLAYRDAELKPDMWQTEASRAQDRHWMRIRGVLIASWGNPEKAPALLVAAIRHALDFQTWRSLVRVQGLEVSAALELMVRLVLCAGKATENCEGASERPQTG
jgi:AcrR family transcriptional regulator